MRCFANTSDKKQTLAVSRLQHNQGSTDLWVQNSWNFAKWDISYGVKGSFTQYQRDGFMRNGRAPENSYGKGKSHSFFNYGAKAAVMFKIDGRNSIVAHGYYGTRAPLSYNAYVSPRIKDDVISNLNSEIIASGDISYNWNFRNFKGVVTGFYTDMRKGTERTSFYDDLASTFMNYALTNVHKVFKGVEVGVSYKLTPNLTVSAAANIGRYQYKNRPIGTLRCKKRRRSEIPPSKPRAIRSPGKTPEAWRVRRSVRSETSLAG